MTLTILSCAKLWCLSDCIKWALEEEVQCGHTRGNFWCAGLNEVHMLKGCTKGVWLSSLLSARERLR